MKHIKKKCTNSQGPEVSSLEICEAMWPILYGLITLASSMTDNCNETFDLAFKVFESLTETPRALVDIDVCLREWAMLLLDHACTEVVGFNGIDPVARGLAKLLDRCASYAVTHQPLQDRGRIATSLIERHLFPSLTEEGSSPVEHKPVLDVLTRKYLNDIVVSLTKKDRAEYGRAMEFFSHLPAYDIVEDCKFLRHWTVLVLC